MKELERVIGEALEALRLAELDKEDGRNRISVGAIRLARLRLMERSVEDCLIEGSVPVLPPIESVTLTEATLDPNWKAGPMDPLVKQFVDGLIERNS